MKALRLQEPAVPASIPVLRHAVLRFFDDVGGAREARMPVGLATSEACTNVVLHAYGGEPRGVVEVAAWREGDEFAVRISDEGGGIRPQAASAGLGMGLPLIAQLSAHFEIATRTDGPGVAVDMRFPLALG